MNLFLVEDEAQLADILNRNIAGDSEWIALSPAAMWALQVRNIDHRIPEDFYDRAELRRLCLERHERLEQLCIQLDRQLWKQHPMLEAWGIRPFFFYLFSLTVLVDGFTKRLLELQRILSQFPEHHVWAHRSEADAWGGSFDLGFSPDETLWGHLLSLPNWEQPIEILATPSESNTDSQTPPNFSERLKHRISRSLIGQTVAENWRQRDFTGLRALFKRNRGTLLVTTGLYEWRACIPHLRAEGWRILFSRSSAFVPDGVYDNLEIAESPLVRDCVESHSQMMDIFQVDGVNFYPLVADRFHWIAQHFPNVAQYAIDRFERIQRKHRIRGVISALSGSFSHLVNQIALQRGIPVFRWQHGFVMDKDGIYQLYDFDDMLTTSVVFAFGERVQRAYHHQQEKFNATAVSAGSTSLDEIRRTCYVPDDTTPLARRKILYVTGNYYLNDWYCGFSPPTSDTLLFADQQRILENLTELVEQKPSLEIAVKLPPQARLEIPSLNEFSAHPNITVFRKTPTFVELLSMYDIVLIEFPTTVALQAVATRKPTFILTRHLDYSDAAKAMLSKRAVCAETVDGLIAELRHFLESGIYKADFDDDEFLRNYGNHLNDGRSLERALEIVDGMMNK